MSEIINNSASTTYTFNGSPTVYAATSNVLPINFENSTGLIITKTPSISEFSIGDIITYSVNITNSTGSYLNGVRIIDNLGNGNLAYVISSARLTYNGQTYPVSPVATNPLTFTLQQLPNGASMTLTYRAQVVFNLPSSVNSITNSISGIGYTSNGTVSGFANATIQKKNSLDFSINKTADSTSVFPKEIFRYYITLENNTDNEANINSVTDNMPDEFTLLSVIIKTGTNPEIDLAPSDYTVTNGNLLTIPSATGPAITVPANSSTVITLVGYMG